MRKIEEFKKQIAPVIEEVEQFRLQKLEDSKKSKKWYSISIVLVILGGVSLLGSVFVGR